VWNVKKFYKRFTRLSKQLHKTARTVYTLVQNFTSFHTFYKTLQHLTRLYTKKAYNTLHNLQFLTQFYTTSQNFTCSTILHNTYTTIHFFGNKTLHNVAQLYANLQIFSKLVKNKFTKQTNYTKIYTTLYTTLIQQTEHNI